MAVLLMRHVPSYNICCSCGSALMLRQVPLYDCH
jgi:hypothetical protein